MELKLPLRLESSICVPKNGADNDDCDDPGEDEVGSDSRPDLLHVAFVVEAVKSLSRESRACRYPCKLVKMYLGESEGVAAPTEVIAPLWALVVQCHPGFVLGDLVSDRLDLVEDRQLGRLFTLISSDPELKANTLVLICSDNGPEKGAGSAGPFRGFKTHLYEGGVRSSLIAWGPGLPLLLASSHMH